MHRPTRLLPLACALICASAVAAAAEAANVSVKLSVDGEVPFTAEELREAVALRVVVSADDDAAAYAVTVSPAGADSVRVVLGTKERLVALEGRKGPAAARRVALAVADLANAEAAPGLLPPEPPKPEPETPPVRPPQPRLDPRDPAAFVGLMASTGQGLLAMGVALDASFQVAGPLRVTGDVGIYPLGRSASVDDISVDIQTLGARAGLAWTVYRRISRNRLWGFESRNFIEVRLEAIAVAYRVTGGDMTVDIEESGMLLGGGLTFAAHMAWGIFAVAGVDVFQSRADFRIHGEPALATHRAAPFGGVGWALSIQ